ncbi:MAG TPA: hypothetical protein VGQ85_06280, partial [Candidatus Limnocylindrales bacterium]|nr:hypothetical protein [Candidatus Limnocylindrales bacterium]
SITACGGGAAATAPGGVPTAAPTSAASSQAAATQIVPPTFPGSGGTGSVDAGTVLTTEMAASIIGGTLTKTNGPGAGTAMSVVVYSNANGDSVTVLVEQVPAGIGTAMLQAAIQAAGAQGTLEVISGLGDAAGKAVTTNEATVAFVKGVNLVVISGSASAMAGADLEPKVESVAQQVAGRI